MKNLHVILHPLLISVLGLGLFSSCTHREPNFIYMPDMVYSPAFKAQKEGSMRMPVKGTISRDYVSYKYGTDVDRAEKELRNPLRPTLKVLVRGQTQYNIYCSVCHGPSGEGNGSVTGGVGRFPQPPSLQSERAVKFQDGRFFHVMTAGQNLMPSYATQISVNDRWAIAHFVRALQRSMHPTAADQMAAEQGD
ncbi:MAG: cytochrome c [Bdellovibrionota bacterium]